MKINLYQLGVNTPADIASGRITEAFLNIHEMMQSFHTFIKAVNLLIEKQYLIKTQ